MNLSNTLLHSFLPRLEKVPLGFTFPKTWKQGAIVLNQGTDYVIPNYSGSSYFDGQLYSITGAKINTDFKRNAPETKLKTSSLSPGVYLLLMNRDSKLETLKIVIQ